MKRGLLCGASAAVVTIVAGLSGSQALAQAVAAPAAAAGDTGGNVEIVASKRVERLEQVPVAVTAFSAQQRSLLGIKTIDDLAQFTPGLSYFNGDDRTFIRGIGRQTDQLSISPSVAVYKDGVYAGGNGSVALQNDTLFIDRIEVDRGPQSTLYGRNSDGGAVDYIFRRPSKDWEEEVRTGIGNYDKYWGEGLVSGPLNDNVRILFGGNYTQENGGYWHNLDGHPQGGDIAQGGNGTSHYLEAQIQANFGNLDWWAKASTGDYLASWYQGALFGPVGDYEFPNGAALTPSSYFGLCGVAGNTGIGCAASPDTVVGTPIAIGPAVLTSNVSNPRSFIGGQPNTTSVKNDVQLSTTLNYHFSGADLKYTGGYESFYYQGLFNDQTGSDSGLLSYNVQGPTGAALTSCQAAFAATPGLCSVPLTISASPTTTLFVEDEQFFSHELDLTSTYKGPLQYIVGLYWFHDHYDQPIDVGYHSGQPQLYTPVGGPPNPSGAPFQSDRAATANSYAAFGQLDWKITDTLKLTGGLRYTEDTTAGFVEERFVEFDDPFLGLPGTFLAKNSGANTPALDITAGAAGVSGACTAGHAPKGAGPCVLLSNGFVYSTRNANFNAVTGIAGVEWTPDSHTLAYAKYSRGYKTGGFDTLTIVAQTETNPEYVDSYEAGLKLSHPTWQLNADVFYYNYTNDQQPVTIQVPQAGGTFQNVGSIANIPEVHTYGLELEGIWHPIDPLVINAQYSYLSAKISSMSGNCLLDTTDPQSTAPGSNVNCTAAQEAAAAVSGTRVQNVVGESLPQAPANKFSISGIYTFHWDPGSLALSASYAWRDKSYGTIFNRPYDEIPSYGLVNLRAIWTDAKNRYTIIAYADNVFNTLWAGNAVGALQTPAAVVPEVIDKGYTYGPPATFGVEFQYRWR